MANGVIEKQNIIVKLSATTNLYGNAIFAGDINYREYTPILSDIRTSESSFPGIIRRDSAGPNLLIHAYNYDGSNLANTDVDVVIVYCK